MLNDTAKQPVNLYGYESNEEDAPLRAFYQVSLCFEAPEDLAAFARFVAECAEGMKDEAEWDHEHFHTDGGPLDGTSIIIARLDPRNR